MMNDERSAIEKIRSRARSAAITSVAWELVGLINKKKDAGDELDEKTKTLLDGLTVYLEKTLIEMRRTKKLEESESD